MHLVKLTSAPMCCVRAVPEFEKGAGVPCGGTCGGETCGVGAIPGLPGQRDLLGLRGRVYVDWGVYVDLEESAKLCICTWGGLPLERITLKSARF